MAEVVELTRRCEAPEGMGRVVVAIDGLGGAGKSTLAIRVSRALAGIPIVHTDDFATSDCLLGWGPRMIEQVLDPLADGRPARYQRYDWDERRLAEWHEIPPGGLLVLEGIASSRSELRPYLAAAVWVTASPEERLRRGLERDGTDALDRWRQWQADEEAYLARDRPDRFADLIVDGQGGEPWSERNRPDKVSP